jgi:hypothetical protein
MKAKLSRLACFLLCVLMLLPTAGCQNGEKPAETPDAPSQEGNETPEQPQEPEQPSKPEDPTQPENPNEPEEVIDMRYEFEYEISQEVLCNYLARAVTISPEGNNVLNPKTSTHIKKFILNTGAKYICRAATCWSPHPGDYGTHAGQKAFIEDVHKDDPYVVFEACIFECISTAVNEIPIPAYVFEAFGLPVEERNFSFDAMRFADGTYLNQWGNNTAVPDITRQETMMFLYHRAVAYIDMGYEGLHMGQVHLIGHNDKGWKQWTQLLAMIREYAYANARRGFVFINAHTHGIIGDDDVLLFDFHMYPSRPMAAGREAHFPTESSPQYAEFKVGHSDSIYGKSLGGLTYSGWECDTLPYLVELDNYGDDLSILHQPKPNDMRTWGMDEITWFANQPDWYRKEFLEYAYDWVTNEAPGIGFFAMPGQRVARIYADETGKNITSYLYMGYDPKNHKSGNGDELIIKKIWEYAE